MSNHGTNSPQTLLERILNKVKLEKGDRYIYRYRYTYIYTHTHIYVYIPLISRMIKVLVSHCMY